LSVVVPDCKIGGKVLYWQTDFGLVVASAHQGKPWKKYGWRAEMYIYSLPLAFSQRIQRRWPRAL